MARITRPSESSHGPAHKPVHGRTNSLNLSGVELDTVLDSLDYDPAATTNPKRQSARMAFRQSSVHLQIAQPGGQTNITVACRNLSRTGLGFLHSSYMHVGAEVIVTLPHKTLGQVRIEGTLVRCRHVKRLIHDVGVQFKEPLNLRDYMDIDTLAQAFSCEKVDPGQLKGVLLIVAEYKIEQGCIQSMLRGTSIEFISAANIAQGVRAACNGCDVIICDDSFEDGTGAEFIAKARQNGVRCPIIIMSADRSTEARAKLRAANASGFLEKPLAPDLLLRAMAEFLMVTGESAKEPNPLTTTLASNSPLAALADDFVSDLTACADDIEKFAHTGDLATIRKRVLRVAGSAPAMGFEPLAKLGHTLLAALDSTKSITESTVPLNTFVATCRSVRKAGLANNAPVEPVAPAKPDDKKPHADHAPPKSKAA